MGPGAPSPEGWGLQGRPLGFRGPRWVCQTPFQVKATDLKEPPRTWLFFASPHGLCPALCPQVGRPTLVQERKENPREPSRKGEGTSCRVVSGRGELDQGLKMRNIGQARPPGEGHCLCRHQWKEDPERLWGGGGGGQGRGFQPALTPFPGKEGVEGRGTGSEQRAPQPASLLPLAGPLGGPWSLCRLSHSLMPRAASSCLCSLSHQGRCLGRWRGFRAMGSPVLFPVRPRKRSALLISGLVSTYSSRRRGPDAAQARVEVALGVGERLMRPREDAGQRGPGEGVAAPGS